MATTEPLSPKFPPFVHRRRLLCRY